MVAGLSVHTVLRRLLVLRLLVLSSFVFYLVVFSFPLTTTFYVGMLVLASAVFSFGSWWLINRLKQPANSFVIIQLLWDSLVILLFVWMAGRSTNPFIYYQLLIIAVSASVLPEKFAWFFSFLGICAYTVFMYVDLGHHIAHMDSSFKLHLMGMWVNFSGSALLVAFFISRLSSALRQQEDALRLAREENLKNEQLIGIGTLAASTVHSFGTPLSTILMATSELDLLHGDEDSKACTAVIKAQIERCKTTMKKLTLLTTRTALDEQKISIADLSYEIKEYLQLVNAQPSPSIDVQADIRHHNLPGGILLLHAIINLVDNAVDAAKSYVSISIEAINSDRIIRILIEDDGDGIPPELLSAKKNELKSSEKGLGIGLLLVNSTIERLGGAVTYRNSFNLRHITQVIIELPCTR